MQYTSGIFRERFLTKNEIAQKVDRVDEILEGYRTFTALAAEVNTPGGSGIMSRYGTTPADLTGSSSSSSIAIRGDAAPRAGLALSPPVGSGTLDDYAPLQPRQQQQPQPLARRGGDEGGVPLVVAAVGARRNDDGRRGEGVPYISPASDPVVMDALRLLFAKEGNYVQDLVSLFVTRGSHKHVKCITRKIGVYFQVVSIVHTYQTSEMCHSKDGRVSSTVINS